MMSYTYLENLALEIKQLRKQIAELKAEVEEIKSTKPIQIVIDFNQFWTTLVYKGLVKTFSEINYLPVPPNYTISWTVMIPPNTVSLITEETIAIYPDHVLSTTIYADGELLFQDNDMVQDRYRESLNFIRLGALKPITRQIDFTIKNNSTTDTAYWSVWAKGGRMEYYVFDKFFSKFFDVLSAGVGLT